MVFHKKEDIIACCICMILAKPTQITWHAGRSWMNGKANCNNFTIGIEFSGNTKLKPLTDEQIRSGIEYLLPIMRKYHISLKNITTHKRVRDAWNKRFPGKAGYLKTDITDKEYDRFMSALAKAIKR